MVYQKKKRGGGDIFEETEETESEINPFKE